MRYNPVRVDRSLLMQILSFSKDFLVNKLLDRKLPSGLSDTAVSSFFVSRTLSFSKDFVDPVSVEESFLLKIRNYLKDFVIKFLD